MSVTSQIKYVFRSPSCPVMLSGRRKFSSSNAYAASAPRHVSLKEASTASNVVPFHALVHSLYFVSSSAPDLALVISVSGRQVMFRSVRLRLWQRPGPDKYRGRAAV